VEDDPMIRRALQRILKIHDFEVSPFASAEDFLDSGCSAHFACLLLDLQLRGLSGVELYTVLANEDRVLPVVFISASPDALRAAEAAAGPQSNALLKPFTAEHLFKAIRKSISSDARAKAIVRPRRGFTL
jgi:FixJ family two-component response regulator